MLERGNELQMNICPGWLVTMGGRSGHRQPREELSNGSSWRWQIPRSGENWAIWLKLQNCWSQRTPPISKHCTHISHRWAMFVWIRTSTLAGLLFRLNLHSHWLCNFKWNATWSLEDGGEISRVHGQQVKYCYISFQQFILNSWVNFLPPNYLWPILKRHDDNSINSFEIWKVGLGAAIRRSLDVCLTGNDAAGRMSDMGSISASQWCTGVRVGAPSAAPVGQFWLVVGQMGWEVV